jgi:hypothetical protein
MPAAVENVYKARSEPVTCTNVLDDSGDSIIYCGVEISQEEILRRAARGVRQEYKVASHDSNSNTVSAIGRLISSLRHGLDVRSSLLIEEMEASVPPGLIRPVLFERFNRSINYRIDVNGMDRLVGQGLVE